MNAIMKLNTQLRVGLRDQAPQQGRVMTELRPRALGRQAQDPGFNSPAPCHTELMQSIGSGKLMMMVGRVHICAGEGMI